MNELDHKALKDVPETKPPWYFRLGRHMTRRRIRGGARLLRLARERGLLDRLAVYSLDHGVTLRVPLWRPCNCWDEQDVHGYEADLIKALATSISRLAGRVTLIDCGADVGTVCAHLASRCRNLGAIVAFEPNGAAFTVLEQNLASLRVPGRAVHAAVSDFQGTGRMAVASEDPSAHAMHLVADPRGDVRVMRIDDLGLEPGLPCVLKVDVEGGEREVIRGATRTIQHASEVVVAFEAHPKVARRTGQDPTEVMRALLASGRDFTFEVDKERGNWLSADRPFFSQVEPAPVYNVIARSIAGRGAP
jgi:FkbM family methyltransferase